MIGDNRSALEHERQGDRARRPRAREVPRTDRRDDPPHQPPPLPLVLRGDARRVREDARRSHGAARPISARIDTSPAIGRPPIQRRARRPAPRSARLPPRAAPARARTAAAARTSRASRAGPRADPACRAPRARHAARAGRTRRAARTSARCHARARPARHTLTLAKPRHMSSTSSRRSIVSPPRNTRPRQRIS